MYIHTKVFESPLLSLKVSNLFFFILNCSILNVLINSFVKLFLLRLYVWMDVLPICMSLHHVHAVPKEAKRASETLELELQMVTRYHVRAGN